MVSSWILIIVLSTTQGLLRMNHTLKIILYINSKHRSPHSTLNNRDNQAKQSKRAYLNTYISLMNNWQKYCGTGTSQHFFLSKKKPESCWSMVERTIKAEKGILNKIKWGRRAELRYKWYGSISTIWRWADRDKFHTGKSGEWIKWQQKPSKKIFTWNSSQGKWLEWLRYLFHSALPIKFSSALRDSLLRGRSNRKKKILFCVQRQSSEDSVLCSETVFS